MKPKYGKKSKLCYMDTESAIVYTKAEEIYIDIAKDVKKFVMLIPKTYSYLTNDNDKNKKAKDTIKVSYNKNLYS